MSCFRISKQRFQIVQNGKGSSEYYFSIGESLNSILSFYCHIIEKEHISKKNNFCRLVKKRFVGWDIETGIFSIQKKAHEPTFISFYVNPLILNTFEKKQFDIPENWSPVVENWSLGTFTFKRISKKSFKRFVRLKNPNYHESSNSHKILNPTQFSNHLETIIEE
jgi:hypothetical protein